MWYRFGDGKISETTYSINCGSQKLSIIQTWPGAVRVGLVKLVDSSGHQIFANPDFQSKRNRRATPFGAGSTECQPEVIFLDPFGEKHVCVISLP